MVGDKSITLLNQKYNERFTVVSVNMNRDEGNWGSADLVVRPENDQTLTFRVVYNYSSDMMTWEDYKGALWNREIESEISRMLGTQSGDKKIKARITSKRSITLDSMNLPYKKDYNEIIPDIKNPALMIDVDRYSPLVCSDVQWPYTDLITMAERFRKKGFEKVMLSVNLYCGESKEIPYQTLRFKLTKDLPLPGVDSVRSLLKNNGEPASDKKVAAIYDEARKLHQSGEAKAALPLYLSIIRTNDNPYRFDPYAPVESGYVIESAYNAAGIEKESGNSLMAERLYTLVVNRVKYFEAKGDYYTMEQEALAYLNKN
jgi:hypothetical protein